MPPTSKKYKSRSYSKGHVSDVLAEVFKRGGMKRSLKRAESVLLWPQVVGSEVARFTEAKTLQDGILYVEVSDSETSMHLMMQRQRFLDVYQVRFGVKDIREIRFRVGRPRISSNDEQERPLAVSIDPQLLTKFARALSDLPEALNQPAMQLAKAMLLSRERKLAAGWRPCILCGALSENQDLCATCQRYSQESKVIRASQALAVDPASTTPLLSEEEREVAVFLARNYLQEKLNELLPHVLADPTYKQELASIARCYVAHALGKAINDVAEEDLDILDSRVARALGRWK